MEDTPQIGSESDGHDEFAQSIGGRCEKVIGVLPLPRVMSMAQSSRCPSPDTQSERSFDASEGRRSDEYSEDDIHVVGEDRRGLSEDEEMYGMSDFLSVLRVPGKAGRTDGSQRHRVKRTPSAELAFLGTDPYARTRGPPRDRTHRPRPPPLALAKSNGRTKTFVSNRQQNLAFLDEGESVDQVTEKISRMSLLPHTPFTRPRPAPKPPAHRSVSDTAVANAVARPRFDRIATDVPTDVAGPHDLLSPIVLVDDPFAKGKSFFVPDDSPTEGTFRSSVGRKVNLRMMGENLKKGLGSRM